VVALALSVGTLVESRNPAARRLDLPGQVLAVSGLLALTFALIEGNGLGWRSPTIVALLGSAAILLVAFVVVEARSGEPMLPLSLFRRAAVSGATASVYLTGFSLLGTVFFSAQYFQAIQGYSPLQAGLRSLPVTLGLFVASPFAGRIAARYGFRPPIFGGALAASAGQLLLTTITPTTPYADLWWKLALIGLGFGVMASPLTSAVMTATPPARAGLASSMVNASRQVGSVFGVALLGAVVQRLFADNLIVRLTDAGVPIGQSVGLAGGLARAGSLAVRAQTTNLPLDAGAMRALTAVAFTDALHLAYAIAGIGVLLVAAMALVLFGSAPVRAQQEEPDPASLVMRDAA
jgi:DHA2 family methylenomycin A resistance protein-like MFS transporter